MATVVPIGVALRPEMPAVALACRSQPTFHLRQVCLAVWFTPGGDGQFDLRRGEVLDIVGESGSRTTLARMLLGLLPMTSGIGV